VHDLHAKLDQAAIRVVMALQQMHNHSMYWIEALFSTHPSTENRVAALDTLSREMGFGGFGGTPATSGASGPWDSGRGRDPWEPGERPRGPWE
jgi:Peptidase family M48